MPNLVCLDISENPIEDCGLRVSERDSLLFDLNIYCSELSFNGVAELLRRLQHMKPLNALSIANNDLGFWEVKTVVQLNVQRWSQNSFCKLQNLSDLMQATTSFLQNHWSCFLLKLSKGLRLKITIFAFTVEISSALSKEINCNISVLRGVASGHDIKKFRFVPVQGILSSLW